MTGKGFALLIALGFLTVLTAVVAGALFAAATTSRTSRAEAERILAEAEMRRVLEERAPRLLLALAQELRQSLDGSADQAGNLPQDMPARLAALAEGLNDCQSEVLLLLSPTACGVRLSDLGLEAEPPRLLKAPPQEASRQVKVHAIPYTLLARKLAGNPSPVVRSGNLWVALGTPSPASAALVVYGPAVITRRLVVLGDAVVYGQADLTGGSILKGALVANGCTVTSENACLSPSAPFLHGGSPMEAFLPEDLPCEDGCPQVLALGPSGADFIPAPSSPPVDYAFQVNPETQVVLSVEGGRQRLSVGGVPYYVEDSLLKDARGNAIASLPRGGIGFSAPVRLSSATPAVVRNAVLTLSAPRITLESSLLYEAPPCESPSTEAPTCWGSRARLTLWSSREIATSGSSPLEVHGALKATHLNTDAAPLSVVGTVVLGALRGTERLTVLHDPSYLASPPPALPQAPTTRVLFWAFSPASYAYPR